MGASGCEKTFWNTAGVISTAVGYEGGFTPNPTYEEVCSGQTWHAEAVRVVFDPDRVSYDNLTAEDSAAAYGKKLAEAGFGAITTEIVAASEFYFAEEYHQQYLSEGKNPYGYCPDHGTGVACPVGLTSTG